MTMIKKLAPLALALAARGMRALDASEDRRPQIQPRPIQNHTVTVDGVVTSSWGVPLVPVQAVQGRRRHRRGDGRVAGRPRADQGARASASRDASNEFATFGGQSVGLHLRQEHISSSATEHRTLDWTG